MRVAAIDLGTNTFHLLIAEHSASGYTILYKTNVPVKLGEGRINENIIIPAAFARGIQALCQFKETILEFGAEEVKATATSAVRSALNGQDFVDAAKDEAGIAISIISGDEEAELIYRGVKLSSALKELALIMDIGGGSVEFILCDEHKLIWKKSYNIGAARLMQQFFKSDPITADEQSSIRRHMENQLQELFEVCSRHRPISLIGSAGAFETFAELIIHKNHVQVDIKTAKTYIFDLDDYKWVSEVLITKNHEQRAALPGMIPLRVDMSVVAVLITNFMLEKLHFDELKLSTFDLKMGVMAGLLDLK